MIRLDVEGITSTGSDAEHEPQAFREADGLILDYDVQRASPLGDSDALEYSDPMSKQQTDEIFARIRNLENRSGSPAESVPLTAAKEPWLKKNAYWFFPVLTLTLGSGLLVGMLKFFFDDLLDHRIDAKLLPSIQVLGKIEQRLSYIEGHLDIASRIGLLIQMPPNEFGKNLKVVSATAQEARKSSQLVSFDAAVELRRKLAEVKVRSPQFWEAAANVINLQADLAERLQILPSLAEIKKRQCLSGTTVTDSVLNYCVQKLDSIDWDNVAFTNSIILYEGGPLRLKNVRFINCIFIVSLLGIPAKPVQDFTEAILSNRTPLPTFTITT